MKDNKHKIFEHGECISEDVLLAYVNNKLNAKEKHVVEKHSLGCDMCADALEGIMMMKNPAQLKGIVESLNKKIGGAGTERKPIVLWMDTRVRVAVAAGLALLIGFFFMFNDSLNGPGGDKTVSDNMSKEESAADSTSLSLDEGAKTDSISSLQQRVTTGKDQDFKPDEKSPERSGEVVANSNGSGGPGWSATSRSTDGDALKSTKELKRDEAPVPPPKDEQNSVVGFNDISTVDRSKSADDKRVLTQTEKKPEADKKGKEDLNNVGGKVTVNSNVSTNEPVNVDAKSSKYYLETSKPDSPKKEEKEKGGKDNANRKDKKKSTDNNNESQKQPLEKSNKGGKDNSQKTAPQSTTVVTGGSSGIVSPNMAPQNNTVDKEITLSKNKQQTDQEDSFTRNDTMKLFDSQLDSVANNKYGYYGNGETVEEKKLNDKDYGGLVLVFSKTLETKPTDREALYKLGDSYLHLNKPDQAIVQFDKLIAMGKGAYYDAARYDKSQALLKQKKNAEAKKLLMEIEQTSTEYKSRAKVDLDKIK